MSTGTGNNHQTKHEGSHQGECGKVEEEANLEQQGGDGENFEENGVPYLERIVEGEGDNNRPR